MLIVYTILAFLMVFLRPENLFAWGPGTHLEIATDLLKEAGTFAPVVVPILKKYREEFIYGMVSADILMAKKYAGCLHHCHNWGIGWKVLAACREDREKASAYGYLTHLAADIVAHNYYVPFMIIKSFDAHKTINHTYWEMRFDMHVKREIWDRIKELVRGDFGRFDKLLESTLKRPIFSFKFNKAVFSTILMLQQLKQLRKGVEIQSRFSEWPLLPSEVRHYKSLAMELCRGFLANPKDADCLRGDAVGTSRLKYASEMRKSLRKMGLRGVVEEERIDKFISKVQKMLKASMLDPLAELPRSYEAL